LLRQLLFFLTVFFAVVESWCVVHVLDFRFVEFEVCRISYVVLVGVPLQELVGCVFWIEETADIVRLHHFLDDVVD